MSPQNEDFTIGVEEEYQVIDPQTRQLCANAQEVLATIHQNLNDTIAQAEFRQSQIEIATPVCRSLQEVRSQLTRLRGEVIAAAAQNGYQIASAGTHPFSHWQDQPVTPKPDYLNLTQRYRRLMQELVTFGCHVHIGIADREIAVQVVNRSRAWLAPLLALSASSPFWLGTDTGHASYRTTLTNRLPMAGPPQLFSSYQEYRSVVDALVATQTIQAPTQICWDIRLSERFPTLEFRITDACTTINETVMIAGLVRALVKTCYEQAWINEPYTPVRSELLLAANWYAARFSLSETLIDTESQQNVSAQEQIKTLLEFVRPALKDLGDWDEVSALVQITLQQGSSAARQRTIYERTSSLKAIVDLLVQETAKGTGLS
ncbi:carboxylate-amine ligase [Egbenema bharatensis]|uniref:carboxylate-amine ligase n=1 Tax=Egbenema bharatensis TaxID=3463334 RepID=UPI003A8C61C4